MTQSECYMDTNWMKKEVSAMGLSKDSGCIPSVPVHERAHNSL